MRAGGWYFLGEPHTSVKILSVLLLLLCNLQCKESTLIRDVPVKSSAVVSSCAILVYPKSRLKITARRYHPPSQFPTRHPGTDQGPVRGTGDRGGGIPKKPRTAILKGGARCDKCSGSSKAAPQSLHEGSLGERPFRRVLKRLIPASLMNIGEGSSPMGGRLPNGEVTGANGKT